MVDRVRPLVAISVVAGARGCAATTPAPPAAVAAPASSAPRGAGARGGDTRGGETKDDFDRSIPATSAALSRLDVPPADLPPGLVIGAGEPRCMSVQPIVFYAQPTMFGVVPKPLARRADVLRRGDRVVGSVLMFEYADHTIPRVREFLDADLWGDEAAPTQEHPEEVAVVGNTLLILCFDPTDHAGDWYKERLHAVHHARLPRPCAGLTAMQKDLGHPRSDDPKALIAAALKHRDELRACSIGAAFLGEIAMQQKDYPTAEASYRRALELDAQGDVLVGGRGALWEADDGLALSVAMQGRVAESVPLFERALAAAVDDGQRETIGKAEFNLACAYAETGKFSDAATALGKAIASDAKYKEAARTDSSFKAARDRPEFQRLLE